MFLLILFLSLIIVSLFILKSYLFGLFFLIGLLLLIKRKRLNKREIIIILCFDLSLILLFLIKKYLFNSINIFIVLERKENYAILFNGFNRYYLNIKYLNLEIDEFDIIQINDLNLSNYDFITLESGFNFNNYLLSKGVIKEVSGNIQIIFNFPFNFYSLRNNILSNISDNNVKLFLETLLFNKSIYDSDELNNIKSLNIINLFSLSGIYISFAFNLVYNFISYAFSEKRSKILTFILFLPYFLIILSKFAIKKFILLFLINFYNEYYINKKYSYIEKLSIIGIFILMINNYLVLSDSFILSFSISFLIYFINNIIKFKNKFLKKITFNFFLMIFILPYSLKFNYSLNVLSFLLSFIFIPINKIFYLLGLYLVIFRHNSLFELIIKWYVDFLNLLPSNFLIINIPEFKEIYIIIYYSLFLMFIYFKEVNIKEIYQKIVIFKTIFLIIYSLPIKNYLYLKVSFINIGQGDSTLITFKNKNYLIDTGGLLYTDIAKNNLIPYFKRNRIYKIDEVFITHYDFDHYGSLESLKANFNVEKVYDYNNFENKEYPFILKDLNIYRNDFEDENDKSLVLYFSFKDINFLFMGDASSSIESLIIKNNPDLTSTYLKVGHHGSKTASSLEFINQINPKEAITSCGKNNKFKHPHEETLTNLSKCNVTVRRTDLEGTINYYFLNI